MVPIGYFTGFSPMQLTYLGRFTLNVAILSALTLLPGCGGAPSDGIAYEGNEQAVKQHMEDVANEERAHLEATAQSEKPAEQRVEEEERAQRSGN
jgi:hypothetical protein